jgi:hypothetical protein
MLVLHILILRDVYQEGLNSELLILTKYFTLTWAGIAQSVYRLSYWLDGPGIATYLELYII